jgi:uncharacterized iron-regulated membrane protein
MKLYRKLHRYFGLIIGIQFLFWTLGGIFFAWNNIDQIHGDFNRKPEKMFSGMRGWVSPEVVYSEVSKINPIDSIQSFKTIGILNDSYYQIQFYSNGKLKTALADTQTGKVRTSLNKEEAIAVAVNAFTPESDVKQLELITEQTVSKHHEYRNQPLPAYAVTFAHKSGTTVYVSTELGQVLKFRNSNWRIFDFMWMMHTMDYQGRDNFGNILLRVFSVLGLITILTGFILYFSTLKNFRKYKSLNQ